MTEYTTGYPWRIAVDLKDLNNPVPVADADTVSFAPITMSKPSTASTVATTAVHTAVGAAWGSGRVVCEIADTSAIPSVPHRLEIKVTRGGIVEGPYYSDVFEVLKGHI
jgi:hypothetical protein